MAFDPHLANVSLLLHGDGADGSTVFADSSPQPKTLTKSGNVAISTAQSKFGGSCVSFAGGRIDIPANAGLTFGTGDFTIELWLWSTAGGTQILFDQQVIAGGLSAWQIAFYQGRLWLYEAGAGGTVIEGAAIVNDGLWRHIAFARASGVLRLFVDGVLDAQSTVGTNYSVASVTSIGAPISYYYSPEDFVGYMDEVRITKGVARYTTAFTPPSEPFPPIAAPNKAYAAAPALFGAAQALALSVTGAWAAAPSPLVTVRAKSGTDVAAYPKSLSPARFGTPMALPGMAPSNVSFQARSLTAGQFGVASFSSALQAGPVQSLQSARFGPLAAHVALAASSLRPVQFGTPSGAIRAHASPLRSARFGTARTVHALAAAPLSRARFGAPGLRLGGMAMAVQSLHPVQFGALVLGGMVLCARTMHPVRFGRPRIDRGATC